MSLRGARRSDRGRDDMRALTADLGNSRLKLCAWRDAVVAARAASDREFERVVADFARAHGPFDVAALSSVAAAEREATVASALGRACDERLLVAPDCGLAIEVREPARVGRDRLYAARGARELLGSSVPSARVVVVDAGTAVTVDAVEDRRFLGGAIAPGPALLARALHEHTARLPLVRPEAGASALGRDTESALRSGVVVGFRGAVRELVRRIASEADWTEHVVVVTGGARSLLLLPEPFTDLSPSRLFVDEDLVHRGLLAAARAALAR